jgi:hypothetical protein
MENYNRPENEPANAPRNGNAVEVARRLAMGPPELTEANVRRMIANRRRPYPAAAAAAADEEADEEAAAEPAAEAEPAAAGAYDPSIHYNPEYAHLSPEEQIAKYHESLGELRNQREAMGLRRWPMSRKPLNANAPNFVPKGGKRNKKQKQKQKTRKQKHKRNKRKTRQARG